MGGGSNRGSSDHETRLRQNSIFTFLSGPDEVWWASVLLLVLASLLGVCILLIVFLIIRASDANKKYKLLLQGSGTDSDLQTYRSNSQDSEMYVMASKKQNGNVSKDEAYAKTRDEFKNICEESQSSIDVFVPATPNTLSAAATPIRTPASNSSNSSNFVRNNAQLSTRSMGGYSRIHDANSKNIYSQDPRELVRLAKLSRTDSARTIKT